MEFSPTSLRTRATCRVCGSRGAGARPRPGRPDASRAPSEPGGEPAGPAGDPARARALRHDAATRTPAAWSSSRHTVPGPILSHSYWYRSGVNRTMTREPAGIAAGRRASWPAGRARRPRDRHRLQRRHPVRRLADARPAPPRLRPSDVTRYAIEKGYDVVRDFLRAEALQRALPDRHTKVITSIAMFYDLEDPARLRRATSPTASPKTASGSWSCTTCRRCSSRTPST